MISIRNRSQATTPLPAPGQPRFHVADLLLPVSLGLWALGVSRTNVSALGSYGLVTALPLVFYAGVALLIVSAGAELARSNPSRWRMSVHLVALVLMLYGTAPLVYSQGRYAWLYKTIGVVQYVNAHGQLNRHIDIYQNWPGFFALAAWFGKVAGVASPLAYAKWAQLAFELAALPLLYLIYDALSLTVRQRWVALLLYSASNWVGQDYFSPQALGILLSLGIMALAIRWLYVGNSSRTRGPGGADRAGRTDQSSPARPFPPAGRPALVCTTIMLVFFVLTFTHELSPYILALQLGVLAVARLLRPRWLPVALAAIAVGYLLPRFAFVNSHYGLLNSIGNFFRNATPPSSEAGTTNQVLIERCAEALSLIMWGLAIAGAWLRRRSGRIILALAILAFSPFILLAVQAYGNEGLLRVYLFSLPWTAVLAASAFTPFPAAVSKAGAHRATSPGSSASHRPRPALGKLLAPLALGAAVALFIPAFYGGDSFNTVSYAEVNTITSFLETARPGPVYLAADNAPTADTATYNLFPLLTIFGSTGVAGSGPVSPDIADVLGNEALRYTHDSRPAYVLIAPSMITYNQAYRVTSPGNFAVLLGALARSQAWKLVVNQSGTLIYELPVNVPPSAFHH